MPSALGHIVDVKLTTLAQLIERCWMHAETETAKSIVQKYYAPNEEQVTFLFASELRMAIAEASATREVEKAFLTDLRRSIPDLDADVDQRVRGLLARVNFHGRQHEGRRSASDLGIIINRPLVRLVPGGARVEVRRDHAIGLLAQAKLGRSADSIQSVYSWGLLTRKQERLLPKRRDYYSLLLYRLSGENAGQLGPFGWQLCRGRAVKQVKQWLHSNTFPEEISSSQVIRNLFGGTIGTKDAVVIQTIIDAPVSDSRFIDIEIFWPDGAGPPPYLEVRRAMQQRQEVHLTRH
jgi:hypothetical protein